MRVLAISNDRSKRGILHRGTDAYERQRLYAEKFGELHIVAFSLASDGVERIDDGPLHIYPTNSRSKLLFGWDAMRLARTLSKLDVVTAQDPFETGLAAWFIARRSRAPLHAQVHTDFLSDAYGRHSLLNRVRRHIAAFVLEKSARVRVVSERIRELLASAYSQSAPITVLPIFVDGDKFANTVPDKEVLENTSRFSQRVLIVSRLESEKNVALGIRAFREANVSGSCLLIAGEGSQRLRLERLAAGDSRIHFLGERDPASLYPLADLVLVTSSYEGYGLVIVEALAAGRQVISTDVGVAREMGALVVPESRFAAEIKALLTSQTHSKTFTSPYRDIADYVERYAQDIRATLPAV